MAAYSNSKEIHAFQKIQKDIKEDKLGSSIVLFGVEDYLIEWSIEEIVKKYINEATKVLDCNFVNLEIATFDDVMGSLETPPMLSEKKIVVLAGYKGEFAKELEEYIPKIPDYSMLIISIIAIEKQIEDAGGKDKYSSLKKLAQSYDFKALERPQLTAFINKRFKEGGKIADRTIITSIINESGYYNKDIDYNLYNLFGDIKKITALADSDEITIQDVHFGLSRNLEHGVFALLDTISTNRKDLAFNLLNQILYSGVNEFKLIANITSQIELMLEVKELSDDSVSLGEMKKLLKVHEFRIKKASNFARSYDIKKLRNILKEAYNIEGRIKSGILDAHMALEMFIAQI